MVVKMGVEVVVDRGRAEALALLDLYDERVRLTREFAAAARPTGVMADAVLAKGVELDGACEVFRRRYYPRRYRVVVALGMVAAVSRSGRCVTVVVDRDRDVL